MGAGLFAQIGEERDVAAHHGLQAGAQGPKIERERTMMPRTMPIVRSMVKPSRVNAVVTMESSTASESSSIAVRLVF